MSVGIIQMFKKLLLLPAITCSAPFILADQFYGFGAGYAVKHSDFFIALGGDGKRYRENIKRPDMIYDLKIYLGINGYLDKFISLPIFVGGAVDLRNNYTRLNYPWEQNSTYFIEYSLSIGISYPLNERLKLIAYDQLYFHSAQPLDENAPIDEPANFFSLNPKFGIMFLF